MSLKGCLDLLIWGKCDFNKWVYDLAIPSLGQFIIFLEWVGNNKR